MRNYLLTTVVLSASIASAADPQSPPSNVDTAIERGLAFLAKDALVWKKEHNCASCHHAALVVWSLREAKLHGHKVDESVLAEMTTWISGAGSGKTSLPRPEGIPKAFNTKAVYFALGLGVDPAPDAASQKALKMLLQTVKEDQLENGSWAARPPLFGGSNESMTALATLALLPAAADGDDAAKAARDKAIQWLADTKTDDDPQSIALRLVIWQRLGRPAAESKLLVQHIAERQNADGGWSQAKEMKSDAWATGQALYALAHAGLKADDPYVARGREFLMKTQRDDGSWPMTSRPSKPGDEGAKYLMPITGAGSAWGVLGLVQSR